MSNKLAKSNGKTFAKQPPKKTNLPLILTAVAIVCVTALAVSVRNASGGGSDNVAEVSDAVQAITDEEVADTVQTIADEEIFDTVQTIAEGEVLSISTADISSTPSFYSIEVDGTRMEVLAVQASDGSIRTAFNTCQSCYTSGRGYYAVEGDELVCQNCGFHFSPDQVEVQSGGCNPWPIFAESKTETAESIDISYDFLKESTGIFANWI